jgi:hypothetical protein
VGKVLNWAFNVDVPVPPAVAVEDVEVELEAIELAGVKNLKIP